MASVRCLPYISTCWSYSETMCALSITWEKTNPRENMFLNPILGAGPCLLLYSFLTNQSHDLSRFHNAEWILYRRAVVKCCFKYAVWFQRMSTYISPLGIGCGMRLGNRTQSYPQLTLWPHFCNLHHRTSRAKNIFSEALSCLFGNGLVNFI